MNAGGRETSHVDDGDRSPSPGQVAPALAVVGAHGGPIDWQSFAGRAVFVVFVPFAFTPVCSGEIAEIAARAPDWAHAGIDTLVISCDSHPVLRTWARTELADTPIRAGAPLQFGSDFWPHGAASRAFGAFNQRDGAADRVTYLVDASRIIRARICASRGQARPLGEYERAVAALTQAAPSSAKNAGE